MAKKVKEIPVQCIRMYLLKESVAEFADALRDDAKYQEFSLKPGLKLSGKLFLRDPQVRTPSWVKFVQEGVAKTLPKIESMPRAAVLFLDVEERIFAIVFGMGRYMLKDTAYEADFGILAALNSVDPEGLRSADTFQWEAVAVHKRTQTSRSTSLTDFEIDPNRAHFRSVTGIAKSKGFADRVTGTEGGLGTNVRLTFADLEEHCCKVLKAYGTKNYQTWFPRYENLRKVTDKAKVAALEDALLKKLHKKQTNGMFLAPPEPLDYEDFSGFSLTPKGEIYDELQVDAYLETRKNLNDLDIDSLKQHRIFVRKETVDIPLDKWSIYKSLICEIKEGHNVFILMNGEWYRISRTFAGQVNDYVGQLSEPNVGLPDPDTATTEPEYLAEVAGHGNGLIVLDRQLAHCEEAGHGIEVCDVITSKRDYIHVKRREGGSASLSHLFNQGKNSALALLRDERFRKEARAHLKKIATSAMKRIPLTKPKMGSFRVVFGIMGKFNGSVAESLPFFSKMSLMSVAHELAERGVSVGLTKIEVAN